MQTVLKSFFIKITIFTLVVSSFQFLLYSFYSAKYYTTAWPFLIMFFFVFTAFMHYRLLKATQGRPQKFIFSFMMFTTVKILLYLGLILIYVLLNRADAAAFILAFLLNYFLFTIFEIISVLKFLKTENS
ncbi:MAG: hypothetical protein B7C24_02770 [Bacteroidetes bacterium 4572_77]|nr:MAG: hypothetical protein B7C24_02770 [Bacteroidetes bacterium 4572_77]